MGLILAAAVTGSLAIGPMDTPAEASTGSTWTTVAALAALVGGIILYNNYEHKRAAANTVVGYTRNGGVVYGDGRIVLPNGQTVYPNQSGYYPWGQPAYYRANATGYGIAPYRYRSDADDRYRRDDDDRYRSGYYRSHPPYGAYARGRGPDRDRDRDRDHGHGHGHDGD